MKQKLALSVFVLGIFLFSGCIVFPLRKAEVPPEIPSKPKAECTQDQDCATGGCSGEICGPKEKVKEIVTVCIYLPEYECLKKTSCRCIDGKCQWEKTGEFKECMAKYNRGLEDFDFKEK